MSYQEKRSLIFFISNIIIMGLYTLFIFNRYGDIIINNPNDFKFWGKTFLILIPISIVANILIMIVFAIVQKIISNEDIPSIEDERDKLIELKSTKIAHLIFIIGFMLSMASQAFGMQPWVMLVTLFSSGWIAAWTSEIVKFYLYRKGF